MIKIYNISYYFVKIVLNNNYYLLNFTLYMSKNKINY